MKFSKVGVAAGALVLGLGFAAAAQAFPAGSAGNYDSQGPEFLLTVGAGGVATVALNPVYSTDPGPYEGSDDTWVGVVNNSGGSISTITLSSSSGNQIFGFDGDGIDYYLATPVTFGSPGTTNPLDNSGYGGANAYFNNITTTGGVDTGNVNFITPIANGGTDYFSLEGQLTSASFTPAPVTVSGAPEPSAWALMIAGVAFIGSALRLGRRRTAMLSA